MTTGKPGEEKARGHAFYTEAAKKRWMSSSERERES